MWICCAAAPAVVAQPTLTLTLTAPASARVNEIIALSASLSETPGSVRYRFVFSDTAPTENDWSSKPLTLRMFSSTGEVRVYVEARRQGGDQAAFLAAGQYQDNLIARSETQTIRVLPALPTIALRASPGRPKAGQPVTWTIVRTPRDAPLEYEFDAGDNTGTRIGREPAVGHTYTAAGTYTASIRWLNAESKPKASARLNVTPAPVPELSPRAKEAEIGEPVAFAVGYSEQDATVRFRFSAGDNDPPTAWTRGRTFNRDYARAGRFAPYVEFTHGSGPDAKAEGRSAASAITIRPALAITLERLNGRTNLGDEVRFQLKTNRPDLESRATVAFGDGEQAVVSLPGVAAHRFTRPGPFEVAAAAESKIGRATASLRVEIGAFPPPVLEVDPASAEIGARVQFRAAFGAADRRTRYRFNFGDNSTPASWSTSARSLHPYDRAGTFPASVTVGVVLPEAAAAEPLELGTSPVREVVVAPAFSVAVRPNATDVPAGEPAAFTVTSTRPELPVQYAYAFSDGTKLPPSNASTGSHVFLAAGAARVLVTATSRLGTATAETGITVTAPIPPELTALPSSAEINETVRLVATPRMGRTHYRYRFDFNDGTAPSEWLVTPETSKAYPGEGTFRPTVEVGVVRAGTVESLAIRASTTVEVPPPLTFALRPVENEIRAGEPMHLAVITNRPNAAFTLDIDFNDGTSLDGGFTGSTIGHTFDRRGTYHVTWTARTGKSEITGVLDLVVLPSVPVAVWVAAVVAVLTGAGWGAHRLGWLRPSLHVKTNLHTLRATVNRPAELEVDFRLNRNLASLRHRLVVPPATPVGQPRKTHV